ncbi:MAG: DUF4304 domain-containing protein [Oscillospiraceae bacterium]|nr:DUF4304 domain-containing protein [Oscillospiraceae bacterium]
MDKETLKLLKAELKDDMKQRGFKTEGQWYMRLVNSRVYQTVYIQGSKYGDEFCVNIGLMPLCTGNTDAKTPNFQMRLGTLAYGSDQWWSYSPASAKDAAALTRKVAFPIFDGCLSYRGLFEFAKPIIDGSGNDNLAAEIFRLFKSDEWVKMLLSLNEPECCKLVLRNSIKKWEQHIETEQYTDVFIKRKELDKSLLVLVESGDLSEIQEEIRRNEAVSLAALTKYIVKA